MQPEITLFDASMPANIIWCFHAVRYVEHIICLSICDMFIASLVKNNNNFILHLGSRPVNKISDADFKVCRESFIKACKSSFQCKHRVWKLKGITWSIEPSSWRNANYGTSTAIQSNMSAQWCLHFLNMRSIVFIVNKLFLHSFGTFQ